MRRGPRFTWQLSDNKQGAKQTAYRILVDTDSASIIAGKRSIWNTGWIKSSDNLVTYQGQALMPFTKYFWKVELTDQDKNKLINTQLPVLKPE